MKELLRIPNNIEWKQTIIRRHVIGVEVEFQFSTNDGVLSVTTDGFPGRDFLIEVIQTDCLAIREYSAEERGWTEHDRFELRINDDDDVALGKTRGTYMRWEPLVGNEALNDS